MWRNWFKRKENLAAIGLALLVLGLHFIVINNPHQMILDEQHYVPEANRIIHGEDLQRLEHPPLGKLFIALGIELFGDNSFGWRFFPIMFGAASIILFYLVCQKLTNRRYVPLLATFLLAFENSCFAQAGVAMLDVFLVTFMLAAFLFYLHHRYISSGVALALSALVKFSAASAGAAIFLHWIFTRIKARQARPKTSADPLCSPILVGDFAGHPQEITPLEISPSLPLEISDNASKRKLTSFLTVANLNGILFLIAAPVAFIALMPLLDYLATGDLLYPWDRIHYMVTTMNTLKFSNIAAGNASHPWTWLTSPDGMAFWYNPSYTSGVNWTMWALIVPSIVYSIYGAVRRNSLLLFTTLWFASTYLVWFPVVLITDRVMFRFYFYPTVGAICLVLGFAISEILRLSVRQTSRKVRWTLRALVTVWVIANLIVFVFMSPLL